MLIPKDFNCSVCHQREKCKQPCPPIAHYVNGNSRRREVLFSEIKKTPYEGKTVDYNEVLAELIVDREMDFDRIVFIADLRKRAIAAMLYVDIPRQNVAELLGLSYKTVYREMKK